MEGKTPNFRKGRSKKREERRYFLNFVIPNSMKTIQVKVKPNARASALQEVVGRPWLAQLKSPPVDGKANKELVTLIARHFGCPKSAVSIKSGAAGRTKLVKIDWT
jgi:uncharacterized protein